MSMLRLLFAGEVKKAESKTAGAKQVLEISLCKKHKAKGDGEPTYTWARVTVWEPQSWQVERCQVGTMVAGSGDIELRSYVKSDGIKGASLEVRCGSFDLEVQGSASESAAVHAAPTAPTRPAKAAADAGDEPPF